jgi:methylthioribose-1-phosphate isomerase
MKQPLEWLGDRLKILDQTRLPREEVYIETGDYAMWPRPSGCSGRAGPAIGVAAGYGVALGALGIQTRT